MTTPDDTMEVVEIVARAIGDTIIPGSGTVKARVTVSHELIERMAAAIPAAIEASGWKIVPVEYTPEMFVAGDQQYDEGYGVPEIYRAMLSASPKVTR